MINQWTFLKLSYDSVLQHSPEYSTPASRYPAVWQAVVQRSTVIAFEPPVVVTPFGSVRPVGPSL